MLNILYEILISLLFGYLLVIGFNYYNLNKLKWWPKQYRTWLKVITIAIPCFFIVNALFHSGWFNYFNFGDEYQSLPGYLNLFATVLTAYLLYRTLTSQNKANKLSAFENRFFKFMDYHRENVSQLEYKDPKSRKERFWKGNQVFTVIYYEICDLLAQIQTKKELTTIEEKKAAINIVFHCVFYGAGSDGIKILDKKFSKHPYFKLIDFRERMAKYDKSKNTGKVYYSGHVRRLGHYFRNIYQAVSYVEDQKFLTENQKYEYVTHFRAQMSVYEQSIFFFNSLSSLGNVWEWEEYSKKISDKDIELVKKIFKKLWITKYDLLRNTLNNDGEIATGISIKTFYPLINLERGDECTVSGILPFNGNTKSICRFCFNERYIGYENDSLGENIKECFEKDNNAFSNFKCSESDCKTSIEIRKCKESQNH